MIIRPKKENKFDLLLELPHMFIRWISSLDIYNIMLFVMIMPVIIMTIAFPMTMFEGRSGHENSSKRAWFETPLQKKQRAERIEDLCGRFKNFDEYEKCIDKIESIGL